MPSAKSSSVSRPVRPRRPTLRATADGPALDQDALEALEFARRGRPDAEIGYSGAAPRLTAKQLADFEPVTFRFTKKPK
jgi:hypothetical protein